MRKLIAIETKRYSAFFRRLLTEYAEGASVVIDRRQMPTSEALSNWCKNTVICQTRDFLLKRHGIELCGFHDHPSDTWMVESELPFVQRLGAERIVRFPISDCAT